MYANTQFCDGSYSDPLEGTWPPVKEGEAQGWTNDVLPPSHVSRSETDLPGGDEKRDSESFNQANGSEGKGFGGEHPDSLVDFPSAKSGLIDEPLAQSTRPVRKYIIYKEYLTIIYCDDEEILRVFRAFMYRRIYPCPDDKTQVPPYDSVTDSGVITKRPGEVNKDYDSAVADKTR